MIVKKRARQSFTKAERAKNAQLKYLYGIDLDDYHEILEGQGGRCAICGRLPSLKQSLVVDHDHRTGDVRGLLCVRCNTVLGRFYDDPQLFLTAGRYLLYYRSIREDT